MVGSPVNDNKGAAYFFYEPQGGWIDSTEDDKIVSTDAEAGDNFGRTVSISNGVTVISAFGDDDNGDVSGSAYIFKSYEDGWTQLDKLLAFDGDINDRFGWYVSIDGTKVIIGAHWDDHSGYGDAGAAYIYEPPPHIVASTKSIEFGDLGVGGTKSEIVTISNTGLSDLFVSDISIATGDDVFTITSVPSTPIIIPPDGSIEVEISFKATSLNTFSNILQITSNDPDVGFLEIPLSGEGTIEWARQIGSDGPAQDFAYAVDFNGNIYVVGTTTGTFPDQNENLNQDGFIRKYDSSGVEIWTRQIESSSYVYAYEVGVYGNFIYVTGSTYNSIGTTTPGDTLGYMDGFIRKYNSQGEVIWTKMMGSPEYDWINDVFVDANGIYVTGYTGGELKPGSSHGGYDAFVRKYDHEGNLGWTNQFGTLEYDISHALTVNENGIFVTGQTKGGFPGFSPSPSGDIFVHRIKLDSTEDWYDQKSATHGAFGLDISFFSDSIYIAGYQREYTSYYGRVLSYNVNGLIQWDRIISYIPSGSTSNLYGISSTSEGVFVAGNTNGNLGDGNYAGMGDVYFRKYDHDGNEQWTKQFGTSNYDSFRGITVTFDSIYIVGITHGSLDDQLILGDYDAFLRKHDLFGNHIWTKQFGGTKSVTDSASCVEVYEGDIYVFGETLGILEGQIVEEMQSTRSDLFISRYDFSGNMIWTRQFGTTGTEDIGGMVVLPSGIYVSGLTTGSFDPYENQGGSDVFVAKFNFEGEMDWVYQFGSSYYDYSGPIALDETGIYISGRTSGGSFGPYPPEDTGGGVDVFIRKIDFNRVVQWNIQFGSPAEDWVTGINVQGSWLYVAGGTKGSLAPLEQGYPGGSNDAYLRKFDLTDRSVVWTRQFGNEGADGIIGMDIGEDGLYVAGVLRGLLPGQTGYHCTGYWCADAFVKKYDFNGNALWIDKFGTNSFDRAHGIKVDQSGVYVTGEVSGALPGQIFLGGIKDAFARKYSTEGQEIWTRQFGTSDGGDYGYGISVDASNVYVVGMTTGTFYGQTSKGGVDAFVAKLVEWIPFGPESEVQAHPDVTMTFTDVYESGPITVIESAENPGLTIPNFEFLGTFYDIITPATYTGPITICFSYNEADIPDGYSEEILELRHWEQRDGIWYWYNITTSRDLTNNIICGSVDSLSWFAIAYPLNLPPEVTFTGPESGVVFPVGSPITFSGTIIDPNTWDSHTVEWTLKSGSTEITFAGTVSGGDGTWTVSGEYTFTIPGVYSVSLTVTDAGGLSDTATTVNTLQAMVVIYDPSGGFVTGGGWINSPEGAYTDDPTLAGKASFGFVSKYKKGTTVPTGQTEFKFQTANLNFHSDNYEWLVVSGARAMFKGTGTINGEGEYNFILTAVDGDIQGGGGADKFRIKIWVEDEVTGEETIVYDNMLGAEDDGDLGPTTDLGGGSIVIHKAK
jgi:hypothetical protein